MNEKVEGIGSWRNASEIAQIRINALVNVGKEGPLNE